MLPTNCRAVAQSKAYNGREPIIHIDKYGTTKTGRGEERERERERSQLCMTGNCVEHKFGRFRNSVL